MNNYFNKLTFIQKIKHLGQCRLMKKNEFSDGVRALLSKKIVIIGCGSQGLNQGLNMRDSGLNITYALRRDSIINQSQSYIRAMKYGFSVGTYDELIPEADFVINLIPDKYHESLIQKIEPLMKYKAVLGYSHGFHIVEIGVKIRQDITVIMVAPKCPGTEVRQEYQRGFGVPALIAVHEENNAYGTGMELAKSWACSIGSNKAGVLESSFVAEVKSDLMGEQTVLCGMLQVGSIFCFDKMVEDGLDSGYAGKLVQNGWEVITEALKQGGITLMMDRLSNVSKLRAFELSDQLKNILTPVFEKHMEDILDGSFSKNMMLDWINKDCKLLSYRQNNSQLLFEKAPVYCETILEQTYFDHGVLMVAIIKASVELAFDIMVKSGIKPESAYYESLHELPLIANTIARKRLYEMNMVISDTAEYGNYLFSDFVLPLLKKEFVPYLKRGDLDLSHVNNIVHIDNILLRDINEMIRTHPIEKVGVQLRSYMKDMVSLSF
ncbi:ketol-acid reductoisomerase [Candidatus Blochmanniella floridana]|uniref:Ketol-acid reductoisomerase (NADP(+)) n=1 Tax=Blochmanniella floridana TaxID=203907 RepID=ILVC_BLOFL|nr:RecName: Full=Ketol-acid reductoisomerase (NADP(+)); Short=KARI; AltName: Full=Acetohydroxy-acid isomeroreductase; Short=AHIR; AltName: Full=Alpha-keto-beta-hydroxylacyl reductoisomerase; AltName: Full=Ketol-acid reductoisomerase type 2; AltName: Full=Ketol-acid reductoisomerase type II [Candidatus Blochmannia floridanus]CAD83266.1 ketol-acid reductoisomerase [Candidatus Blochmannia floridanus]